MRRGKIFLALMLSASMTVSSVCPAIAADAGEVKTEASASDKEEKKAEEKKAEEKKAEEKKAEEKKAEEKKAEEKKAEEKKAEEKASEEKKEKDEKSDEKTDDKKDEDTDSGDDKKDSVDKEEKTSGDSEKDEDSQKNTDKELSEEAPSDKGIDDRSEVSSIEEVEAKTETDHVLSSGALLRAAEDEEESDSDGEDEKAAEFVIVEEKLVKQGDDVVDQLTLSGTDIDYLYLGSNSEAEKADKDDWIGYEDKVTCQIGGEKKDCFRFVIPVERMDTELKLAYHDAASDQWLDREITFKSSDLEEDEDDEKEEDQETGAAAAAGIADGSYTAKVSYTGTMFRVVDNKLTVKDGKATIHITLSGSGYNALYEGSVAAAQAAAKTELYTVTGQAKYTDEFGTATGYTFDIPVPVFDKAFDVAARGTKSGKWFAKTITVSSEGLKSSDSKTNSDTGSKTDTSGSTAKGSTSSKTKTSTETKTTKVDKTADTESKYVSDLSGSTKKVDAATALADGVYTPDRFTWSGGTGKVHITCKKISVKGGKAYATIQFSSGAYPYVKASGNKYTGSHTASTSTFVIPVALNKNNTIIGMTTKMSANHEIKYSLFIYLAAAASGADAMNTNKENPASTDSLISSGNKELDEEAPSIVGLEYKEEASVTKAELFKMFKYDNGITLIEIDMKSKTARALTEDNTAAGEENKDASAAADDADSSAAAEASDADSSAAADESGTDSSAAVEASDTDNSAAADESDADSSSSDTAAASDSYDETMADDVVVETTEEETAKLYQNNIVKYLIVPEGEEVPVGLEKDAIIVQKPVDSIYVSSEDSLSFLKKLNLTDKITACGWDETTCNDADLKKEISDGKVAFAGSWDDTQMKKIVGAGGQLALLPSDILAKESDDASKTAEEKEEAMQAIAQKYAMLHIPMLVDRSADESTEQGKAEWAQVYGALFGLEKQAEQLSK